ncbi:D-alanyl-D-alanine dipeptidase [Merismopedia glauca CCAP 1448/3]|uniref:D-alanyl-D-alanine dipeptidase n=2 Tax=Merismopedia TaxID=53402 RepID=A0A2T1C7V1_9CYAN|nr:D-alanyl-D-alanine dipeptidase [Merismopedia glauca CCAP 1448/3]
MPLKKPYQQIPIIDCGEPLVAIDMDSFAIASPHPYTQLGAPYGNLSPYYLRQSAIARLWDAQTSLQKVFPKWQIQIFDAYRPVEVQQFMVDYTFNQLLSTRGLNADNLSENQEISLWEQVYQFWAPPCIDRETPPPHSTGAAVDVTLVDEMGQIVDMGGEIDEISAKSHPNYFATSKVAKERQYNQYRELLKEVMFAAGFRQHPNEWWHFCFGDQMWAWLELQADPHQEAIARYGRVF